MIIRLEITDSTPGLIHTLQGLVLDLEHGAASLGDIAHRLALSERTLRRRLRALGTSYNKILRDVRSSIAQEWLRDSTLTIESIAWRLGYTETANFRHAFKRWTGQSPQAFRRHGTRLRDRPNFQHYPDQRESKWTLQNYSALREEPP